MTYDLNLSPKFAFYLSQKGQLDALIIAYQEYRESQNYPFELKDKRIAKQSIFKGLCEFYASQGFNQEKPITKEQILKETEEIVEKLWDTAPKEWEKRAEKESGKMIAQAIGRANGGDKKTFVLDIKGRGKAKDFHAECHAESKEEAYEILAKQYPGIEKSKKESVLKVIILKTN